MSAPKTEEDIAVGVPVDPPAPKEPEAAKADGEAKKEGAEEEAPKVVPIGELFKFADGVDKTLMVIGSFSAFINGAGMPAFSEVFGRLINELAEGEADVEDAIGEVALLMVYVGLVVLFLSAVQVATWMIAAERQSARVRAAYFEALLSQDGEFYDENKPGGLTARLVGDTKVMKAGLNDKIATGVMNFGMFVFGYGLGFYHSWKLTLVIFSTFPIIAGTGTLMTVVLTSMTEQSREHFAAAGEVSEEVLQSVRTVQLFGGEEREISRFGEKLKLAGAAGIKKEFTTMLSMGVSYGVIFSSYSLAFWFGGYLIREGETDVGTVTAVFFSVLMGSFGAGLVFPTIGALSESQGAAYKIYEVLDRKPAIDPRVKGSTLSDFRGEITFENVAFSYPTRRDTKLFTDLCLTVEPGTTVAFSGASGCGKSSIIALVQRLYDADAGTLRIDGTDIKELDVNWWRDQIGIVSQEPTLFSGTIADNVRIGKPDATDAEVEDACRKANVHDTVKGLPDGYDTNIGNVGSQLSGGQKQRLAIARAIIRRPRLLILDEATSALDRKSEAEVQAALDEIMRGGVDGQKLTTLVIAHRLTTIRNVDKIHFIVHDGNTGSVVAESGTFDELVEKKGHFAAMVSKQQASMGSGAAAEDDDDDAESDVTGNSFGGNANTPFGGKADSAVVTVGTPGTATGNNTSFGAEAAKKLTLEERADQEVKNTDVSLGRVIKLSGSKSWAVVLGLFASLITGGIYPAYAVVLAKMLEVLGTKSNEEIEEQSGFWAGMFCVIGLSVFLGYSLQGFYAIAGEHVTEQLRTMLFRNILRQDQTFFDTPGRDVGSLGKVLEGDTEAVHLLFGPALGYKVQMACNLTVGIIIAMIYQWKLALVTMSVIPLMVLAGAVQQMLLVGFSSDNGEDGKEGVVAESLGNVRTVMAFNISQRQCDTYATVLDADQERGKKVGIIAAIVFGISQFTFYGTFALSFWYGGKLMANGEADFTDVMIASMAVLMGAMGAGEAGGFASKTQDAAEASKRVFALIDHVPAIDPARDDGTSDFGDGCTIDFRNVKFVYPSRPKAVVLSHFEDQFKDGSSVGLMGSTGCGKSTIIQMLGRFYDPVAGSVEINGRDLRSFDVKTWRHSISAVLQEPSLFSGSVYDNICYGVPNATKEDVERVARLASIHDEILKMEKGYETDVGYKGRALSGGQKQRVAIARGLLRKPRLLLLDEATSALDNATEANVMSGLAEYCSEHKTTIVSVAHRLTTIQGSDKIVLLDAGVVLERGSHKELMELDGHYARRWEQYQAGMK